MAYKNKEDQAKAARKHYELNKEKIKNRTKLNNAEVLERNKNFVWDYLKTHECVDCGEKDPIVLEFDHKDTLTKKFSICDGVRRKMSLSSLLEEINKCEVRCANCHRRKTATQFNYYKIK